MQVRRSKRVAIFGGSGSIRGYRVAALVSTGHVPSLSFPTDRR